MSNHTPPIRIPQLTWAIHECRLIVGMLCCYSIHLALEISRVKPEGADQPTGDQADSHTAKQRGRFAYFYMLGYWDYLNEGHIMVISVYLWLLHDYTFTEL